MNNLDYLKTGYYESLDPLNENLSSLRELILNSFQKINTPKNIRIHEINDEKLSSKIFNIFSSETVTKFLHELSETTRTNVTILPPFAIMKDYHVNRKLSNSLGWHRDCGGELLYPECVQKLKEKNYVFGKIGIYLQPNNDFGGSIDVIPFSHTFINKKYFFKKMSNLSLHLIQKLYNANKNLYCKISEKNYLRLIKGKSIRANPLTPVFFDSRIYHRATPISDNNIYKIKKISDFHYDIKGQENKIALYAHFGNSIGAESYLYDRSKRSKNKEELNIWSQHISIMKNYSEELYYQANEIFKKVNQQL